MQTRRNVSVVTGAARNIGAAISARLVSDGWTVIAIDRDGDALTRMCDELGGSAVAVTADLAVEDPIQLAARLHDSYGLINGFVANAGVTTTGSFLDLSPGDFDHVLAVNVRSHFFMAQAFARHLVTSRESGSFVFMSSVHQDIRRGHPHYAASKAAVAAIVREAAAELGPHGIRVNAVAPGFTTADDSRSDPLAVHATPIGRPVRPDEIADVVAYLLSPKAAAVNGANWAIDGGLSTHSWVDHMA